MKQSSRDAGSQTPADPPAVPDPRFPAEFLIRAGEWLGEESAVFLEALARPEVGLRVNTLRLDPERFQRISPFELAPLSFPKAGFRVTGGPRPGKHPYHAAGLFYLQDPGAMTVAALLDPRPGERVLDLAAAPGGKSTHLAALMHDQGVLVANDVSPARARELAGNLERMGARNAAVTCETAERLAEQLGPWFDRVLLDAPCSGESMFHKSEVARAEWSPAAVLGCARRQVDLLRQAARMVRPGGLLVYSTCTFSPEEDEGAVARFLADHPDFEVESLAEVPGAEPGRPEWVEGGGDFPQLTRTMRLWPHRVPGAGHYVAGLRRVAGDEPRAVRADPREAPRSARATWLQFAGEHLLDEEPAEGLLVQLGDELIRLPEVTPPLGRLRVVRSGWWLGTVRPGRFEPSHTLAMGLAADRVRNVLSLDRDDPAVLAFLRGETLRAAGQPGWLLVAVDGFALGWGKRVGDTVKNHYPKGLRWR